jgi:cell division protein FtsB
MSKKRNVKFIINVLASKGSLLVLGLLTIWLGASAAKEAYKKHQVKKEIDKLSQEILNLEQKNSNLVSLIDSFKDQNTVELEAKRRLNLKKQGEEVAVILRDKNDEPENIIEPDEPSVNSVNMEDSTGSSDPSNAIKWWGYITGE